MRTTESRSRLDGLTGLRFFAALGVVLFHRVWQSLSVPLLHVPVAGPAVVNAMQTGYVGVSFFFVLSGFILSYSYLTQNGSMRGTTSEFWIARVARIYPAYLLVMGCAAALGLGQSSALHVLFTTFLVGSLTQAWFPSRAMTWDPAAWSLSAEAFFYLLFPLIVVIVARLNPRRLIAAAGALWLVGLLAPAIYLAQEPARLSFVTHAVALADGAPLFDTETLALNLVKFLPLFHLPEFLLGMLAGRLFVLRRAAARPEGALRPALLAVGTAATCMAALCLGPLVPSVLLFNGLLALLFAILIYAFAWGEGLLAAVLAAPVLVFLGEASYALYLVHLPLWAWLARLRLVPADPHGAQPMQLLLFLVLAIGVASLIYRFVEQPFRRAIRSALAPAQRLERASAPAAVRVAP